ncbi:MFS transporter [Rhizomonospora bruguierae]|uniref:MFS transporter n=1 Tax=Rhizomonospora bruguierae TaxID=1581705 RepID=UPI001BD05E04|nr:MFS transporter [Micromonospora sp. NBRC 107566]
MLGLAGVPGIVLAVGMMFVPDSPRWPVGHGRRDDARRVLRRLRGTDEVKEELDGIEHATAARAGRHALLSARVRPMLVVGAGLAAFQQLIGINTVIYYAPTILSFTGLVHGAAAGRARAGAGRAAAVHRVVCHRYRPGVLAGRTGGNRKDHLRLTVEGRPDSIRFWERSQRYPSMPSERPST